MNIPKWMKRHTAPPEVISKIEMVHTDLCEAEDDVREYIDKIENMKPTCLRRDEAKINILSRRLDGLRGDRDLLRDMKRTAIITGLNKFQINTPCTFAHICKTVGIVGHEVREAMMRQNIYHYRSDAEKDNGPFPRSGHDSDISRDGMMLLEDRRARGERYIHDSWRLTTIKICGWRFVQSGYGHIYLERIS